MYLCIISLIIFKFPFFLKKKKKRERKKKRKKMSSSTPLLNPEGYNNKINIDDIDDFNDKSFSYIHNNNFQNNEKKANSLFKKALLIMIGIFILFEVILSTITLT